MKYCSTCGKELADADLFCGSCGTKCENPVPQQAPAQEPPIYQQPYQDIYQQQYQQYQQPGYSPYVYEAQPVEQSLPVKDKVLSIIGMVLGLISLVWAVFTLIFSFIPVVVFYFALIGYEFAIPGMILSSIGNKSGNSKMGKVGKVFSLICIILFGVLLIVSIIMTAALGASLESGSVYYF